MGLFDRDYMSGGGTDVRDEMKYLWALIAVNVIVFLFTMGDRGDLEARLSICCPPDWQLSFQLLTAGFVHMGFNHILFNMWGLYIFGKLVVPHLGGRNFLYLYLAGVLCGNLLFLVFNWNAFGLLCGASGAVCAVMMAAAMLEPERRFVMLFMPFTPIKTTTLVICYTLLEIVFELTRTQSGVAHLAHLGGFLGGYILVKIVMRGNVAWDPFRRRGGSRINWKTPSPEASYSAGRGPVSRDELDALLDKISRSGINSLTPEELERLKRAREEMRR